MWALLDKIPFWLGWTLVLGGWFLYAYLFDDTRVGHPDYKSSKSYSNCVQQSSNIYRERLAEANADSSLWQLSGHESPTAFAESSRSLAKSYCD